MLGACALTADLALLSHGDQTLVGELGTRLRRPAAAGRPGSRPLRPGRYPAAGQPLVCARPHGRGPGTGAGARLLPGPTRLLVSHDPDVLARCDRVIRIEQGRLVELDAHQLADLVQHPQPPRRCPLRRRSSSMKKGGGGKVDWGLFGFMWQRLAAPGAILLVLLLTLGQEGLRIASDLWLGGKAEVSDVTTLLGIYVLLGRAPSPASWRCGSSTHKLGLKLAWTLFDGMLGRISRAPMAFFDKVPRGASSTASTGIWGGAEMPLHAGGTVRHAGVRGLAGGGDRHQHAPVAAHRPLVGWRSMCCSAATGRCNLLRRQSRCCAPRSTSASARPSAAPLPCAWPGPSVSRWTRCCTTMTTTRAAGTPPPPSTAGSACTRPLLSAALVGAWRSWWPLATARCWGAVAITYAFTASAMLNSLIRTFAEVEQVMNAVERVREYSEIESERQEGRPSPPSPRSALRQPGAALPPDQPVGAAQGELLNWPQVKGGCAGVRGRQKPPAGVLQAMYPCLPGGDLLRQSATVTTLHRRRCAISTTPSPQIPLTFFGSLRANLAPLTEHEDAMLEQALARVGLAERCAGRLDEDLDRLQLSAGETQLLVIARILLSRRPLIVLDEATSDLDHGGMRKMAELLYRYRPEASYLAIAHHLEPLLSVDKVVVMEAGTVVEQGSPVSLLANSHSRFHQLFAGQVNRQVPQTA